MYITLDLTTTKKGNHALMVNDNTTLVLDKEGNKSQAIYENKYCCLLSSKTGSFIITKANDNFVILQITKIIRTVDGYEDTPIQSVPPEAISYKAVVCVLNQRVNNEWERPLINRIKNNVNVFVNEVA